MITIRDAPRRALFCAPLPPEFDKESGSRRIYHLLTALRARGWSIAFVCENAPADSPHVRHLRQMGVATYVGFGGATADLVESARFDVAVIAFWYLADRYAEMINRLSPSTRIVVETVDLHWLRNARRLLAKRADGPGRLDADFGSDFVRELNAYARADAVLSVSEKEAALINDLVGVDLAHAVPDYDDVEMGTRPFHERKGLVFVGNFRHPPNLDAVEHLCGDVLPLLPSRLREEHPLYIVGNAPGERVHRAAARAGNVHVVGWVPSVVPYFHAARVSVVPLRYGAGTKRKLIQALLAGTPTVSTPAGVEGIGVTDEEHVLVAEDDLSFSSAVEHLLTDEEAWMGLSRRGRGRMEETHGSPGKIESALEDVLIETLRRPRRIRPGGAAERPTGSPEDVVRGVKGAVEAAVPPRSRVLVVSKGDPALLELPGREASHFPQDDGGRYAGYHPRSSRDAIEHLKELRGRADFLLVPAPAFWWLDYYAAFARHLGEGCEEVWTDESCRIFRLTSRPPSSRPWRGSVAPRGGRTAGRSRTADPRAPTLARSEG